MTELSTAPTTSPANSNSHDASPQDAGLTPGVATASAATVLAGLEVGGWKTLHHLETAEKHSTAIDHLAIGPGGIFVVDAHSWTPATVGPEQTAALNAAGQLANQIRMLLPPLTRQYVVPLLTYVDASPMSMLRGSIQVCTTSMLQGVISSRRPVLNAAEIDDVVASLSSGLRTSSGVAASKSSPSTAPTRRGFLRKGSRGNTDPVSPAPDTAPVAPAAPPTTAVEPEPAAPMAEQPTVGEVPHVGSDLPADHDYWPTTPAVTTAAVEPEPTPEPTTTPALEPQYDHSPEPTAVVVAVEPEPSLEVPPPPALESHLDHLPEPTAPAPDVEVAPSLELSAPPALEPEDEHLSEFTAQVVSTADVEGEQFIGASALPPLDEEVADLAHPVVPSDSSWDLIEEPQLETEGDDERVAAAVTEHPADERDELEPQPDATPEAAPAVLAPVDPATTEPIQPSLTASAVSASTPPQEPMLQRRPGGRRKAPVSKTGVSRLIPTLAPRPSGRSSRRSAAASLTADGESSQEGDLDHDGLIEDMTVAPDVDESAVAPIDDPTPAVDPAVDQDTALADADEDQGPVASWETDEAALVAAYASAQPLPRRTPAQPEPAADARSEQAVAPVPADVEPELVPAHHPRREPDPVPEPEPIVAPSVIDAPPPPAVAFEPEPEPIETRASIERAYTAAPEALSEAYDFAELDEPLPAARPQPAVELEDEEPPAKRQKKSKTARLPRLRRSKDRDIDDEDDVDLSQMPSNLSERGRQMYVEMQRRPKVDPTPQPTVQTGNAGRAGAVRKLFVFCVIGGAIGISSSHYDEINGWVSTHVEHLPGLNKIEGPPQPELPEKAKQKKAKKVKQVKGGQGKQ